MKAWLRGFFYSFPVQLLFLHFRKYQVLLIFWFVLFSTINGTFIPAKMFSSPDGLLNLIENRITIHFFHRLLAYLLFILILIWTWKTIRASGNNLFLKTRWLPFLLVTTQVILGVFSVLASLQIVPNHWGVFEWLAQFHQLIAMFLLLSLVWMAYLIKSK